jgi:hypothetical protein
MRMGVLIITVALMGGCAAQKPVSRNEPVTASRYLPATSGSLVFDSPITQGDPRPDLSRQGRGTDAFVGYETQTTTYFYLRTDDRVASDWSHGGNNRYERRAVSTMVGVSYR